MTGAVVGGAIAATRPPPPRYGRGGYRGRYHRQIVVVRQAPAGMPALGPNERLVLVTCPEGVSPGGTLEIEVEGQHFQVSVPQGVWAGKQFYARVQLQVQQPIQATATATAAPAPAQQYQQQATFTATASPVPAPAAPGNFTVTATEVPPAPPTAQQVETSNAQMASAVVMDDKVQAAAGGAAAAESNPFLDNDTSAAEAPASAASSGWAVTPYKDEFEQFFWNQGPDRGKLSPAKVKDALLTTGLPKEVLRSVWELSDIDKDGMLDMDEFSVAMYLCRQSQSGFSVPAELPADVVPPSKRYLAANPF